jgi:hypothetical protein
VPAFRPDAVFLGASTPLASNATDTPVVVFGPGWGHLFIYHYIAGYSSGGSIALLRFGTATTVDTGTNYSSFTSHWITTATVQASTSRVSQTGIQVANDSTTNGRRGQHEIYNPSGSPKSCDSRTITFSAQTPVAASTAMATQSVCQGFWWNNAQAQCVAMNGGGVSLLTGSFIAVYGIPGTG